ncbi:hypothetical protein F4779DRAFT_616200 [Xylariaceae sp. FL0662B]|nr:hypothetical protein F4779DRAFT_616200 [Xylariaceae sp. FL0662B]
MATIDYIVTVYGPYPASATGSNGFPQDFLAGILTWCAVPYYRHFMFDYDIQTANTILAAVSVALVMTTFDLLRLFQRPVSTQASAPFNRLKHIVGGTLTGLELLIPVSYTKPWESLKLV